MNIKGFVLPCAFIMLPLSAAERYDDMPSIPLVKASSKKDLNQLRRAQSAILVEREDEERLSSDDKETGKKESPVARMQRMQKTLDGRRKSAELLLRKRSQSVGSAEDKRVVEE